MKKNITGFAAALTLLAGSAAATNKIDIATWAADEGGRDGWSVKKLIGTKAFGPNRKEETPHAVDWVVRRHARQSADRGA